MNFLILTVNHFQFGAGRDGVSHAVLRDALKAGVLPLLPHRLDAEQRAAGEFFDQVSAEKEKKRVKKKIRRSSKLMHSFNDFAPFLEA